MDYLTCYQFPNNNENKNGDDSKNIDDDYNDGNNDKRQNTRNQFPNNNTNNNDDDNNSENVSLPPKVFTAGQKFGLSLILNVDQKEYLPFVIPSAGVRVAIHEYGTRPNLMQKGQSVAPGFETSIGIRPDCERLCLNGNIEKECECNYGLDMSNTSYTFCDIACVKSVISRAATEGGNLTCFGCKIPCRSHYYSQRVSTTYWPSDNYDLALKAVLSERVSSTDTRRNLLSLKIYLSELTEETVVDEPAYEWESLVRDIGGQLGLWLGMSFLSLCEIIELFCLILGNCCKGRGYTTSVTDIRQQNK